MKQHDTKKDMRELIEKISTRQKKIDATHAKLRAEHAILVNEIRELEKRVSSIIDSEDRSLDAIEVARCVLGESIQEDGKRFQTYNDPIEKIIAPIQAIEQDSRRSMRTEGMLVRHTAPQKKQIKTLLHTILELTNERGKMKLKDIAKEIEVDESILDQWVKVMDKRGMVHTSYSLRGEVFVEKAQPHATP